MRPASKSVGRSLRDRALRMLAQREHSRAELTRKLLVGGAEKEAIAALVDEFQQRGWISDERFACARVHHREGRYSRRYIADELGSHGVSREATEAALAQSSQNDYAAALALWQQKFGEPPTNQKEKARQVRFLQSRGFDLSTALKVIRDASTVLPDE